MTATQTPAHILSDEDLAAIRDRLQSASTRPWRVESDPERFGDNWWLFSCGNSQDGKDYYVTTDGVHASEDYGDPATDAAFIVWCRNDMGRIGNAYLALRAVYADLLAACEAYVAAEDGTDLMTAFAGMTRARALMDRAIAKAKGSAQ